MTSLITPDSAAEPLVERPSRRVLKPHFAPGQSLEAGDLTALVEWTSQRLQLAATCRDWGVVCGLNVLFNNDAGEHADHIAGRCPGDDPQNNKHVIVRCGVGFDAWHRPCLMEADDAVSLGGEPCWAACTGNDDRADDRDENDGERDPWSDIPDPVRETCKVLGIKQIQCVRAFDVFLKYTECVSKRRIARSPSGERTCVASRKRLTAKPYAVPVCIGHRNSSDSSASDAANAFCETADAKFTAGGIKSLKSWLLAEQQQNRDLWHVPRREIEALQDNSEESNVVILLDRLAYALRRDRCPAVNETPDIPLARIWVVCRDGHYEPVWIDDSPSSRRRLHCAPSFHARQWIGGSLLEAQRAAAACGFELEDSGEVPNTIQGLQAAVERECEVLANASHPVGTKFTVRCQTRAATNSECLIWMFTGPASDADGDAP